MISSRRVPDAVNEPPKTYAPGAPEREELKARLASLSADRADIPVVVNGTPHRTGDTRPVVMPFAHRQVVADVHAASPELVHQAIDAALAAGREWAAWPLSDRAAVFLRAADLLATSWRPAINAATMLGQAKTVFQAEIDAACELVDFLRFNAHYAQQIADEQPLSVAGAWNATDYRALEGFVYAVSPFNFTAIGGNLPTAPALMGNTVVWKPASTAVLSNYVIMSVLEAAGLPPGVINFVPGDAQAISDVALASPHLAGVHFTGSTSVFHGMWRTVGNNVDRYRSYPRLVGETGGKDFVIAHASADPQALAVALVRGAFEYQGQKCSAASRAYVPASIWNDVRDRVIAMMREIRVGDVRDFRNFMSAVIDRKAFDRIHEFLDDASRRATILQGGACDAAEGYFVEPTLIQTADPTYRLMCEEIFGPVLTVYVYPDGEWSEVLRLVDRTSPYALTGAVFATDRRAIHHASEVLRQAAGNFYVNDKPTGAVVGQQPFGGARASGTNDKAGSKLNLLRWISARTIKETLNPPLDYRYPFMQAE